MGCSRRELPQDVVQNAAVAEILDLVERIDPAHERNLLYRAVQRLDLSGEPLARLEVARHPADRDGLVALQPEGPPPRAALEHEGRDPHADKVRAVDALETLRNDGAHPEQVGALGRPVAR